MNKFFVCTAIPYVNAELHIGHTLDFLYADALARYHRRQGHTVVFSTGADEHGSKIAEKAASEGLAPQKFTDHYVGLLKESIESFHISYDRFTRTTDPAHIHRAQTIWTNLAQYIYQKEYVGWYCTGCEEFATETTVQAHHGMCPNHNRPYEQLKETNYFFKASAFNDRIQEAIETGSFTIAPESRRNEFLAFLRDGGLDDISISRPKEKLQWGIPVPHDDNQVMYVWFEALMNYITVIGYPEHPDFATFWPADVQVIGKDILRFHAGIWPAMLLGLGLPLPKTLFVHGFVTHDGQKMSKSIGNVVAPRDIIETYGVDSLRYFFFRHISAYEDGDFSWERFRAAYANELANELGNGVQRVASMINRYMDGVVGDVPKAAHDQARYHDALANFRFDQAIEFAWEQVRGLNQYIDAEKPWSLYGKDDAHLHEVLAYCVGCLREIAELLEPFLPDTALKIATLFNGGVVRPFEGTLFPKLQDNTTSTHHGVV